MFSSAVSSLVHVGTAGAGGGGGGGVQIIARGRISVAGDIRANGGDGGSNGPPPRSQEMPRGTAAGGACGGGSGGSIVLQATGAVRVASCDHLQVEGGKAGESGTQNRTPPAGEGAAGWIRIESARGETPGCPSLESLTTGTFLADAVESIAVSKPILLGLGADGSASSFALELDEAVNRFVPPELPPGTRAVVLWEGARESLDFLGQPGRFRQRVDDPRQLRDRQFVRFSVLFLSDRQRRVAPSLDEILLRYRLAE